MEKASIDVGLLEPILLEYRDQKGAVIPILQRAQDIYGYLPEEAMIEIAKKSRISISQLYGIATFYAQFTFNPEGKIAITTCDGTACHVQGGPLLKEYIENNLQIKSGETTEDGLFSLKTVACIGCCAIAPAIIVNEEVADIEHPERGTKLKMRSIYNANAWTQAALT